MTNAFDAIRVRDILEHVSDHPWRFQDVGLLSLWLDDRHEHRLHVWDPEAADGEPPVHDHPFDFTSTVVVGELVNTRYVEDPHGVEYLRERYTLGDEGDRRSDTVRLVCASTVLTAGARYRQDAHELHDSRQHPGTVTVMRFERMVEHALTVCRRPGTPWVSGQSRTASAYEVERITAPALAALGSAPLVDSDGGRALESARELGVATGMVDRGAGACEQRPA